MAKVHALFRGACFSRRISRCMARALGLPLAPLFGRFCGGVDRQPKALDWHCLVGVGDGFLWSASGAVAAPTARIPKFLYQLSNRMQKVVEHGFLRAFREVFGNHPVQVRAANLGERLHQFFMDVRRC